MEETQRLLMTARKVAVLTGAGVSAESGIPTFRGPGGLWRNFRPEELATPEAFARDPRLVWEWYAWRREIIAAARPNAAHLVLARMEEFYPDFTLITQNIDGLHQAAGSKNVVELHGNIWRVRCLREGRIMEHREVPPARIPPLCECGGLLRPDVVWFGEALPEEELSRAFAAAESCEVMLVVGTSGVVQPAASLPYLVRRRGGAVIEFNTERTPISQIATRSFFGPAARVLPELWEGVAVPGP